MSVQDTKFNAVAIIAAILWLAIPVTWSTASILDRTRAWEGSPQQFWMIGWAALVVAGVLTLWMVVRRFDRTHNSSSFVAAAFAIYGLGLAASVIVGWALVVWMTLYGAALLMFAGGMGNLRRVTRFVGGAMLAGVAAQIILTMMKLGTPDSYGDYPIAWTTSMYIATVAAAIGLYAASRDVGVRD